ncbi:hypothetical protein C8R47DRAFT_711375 [Mycena vitilis]|nr:hypothetical protein C8R47DRAFT_711375 [Mycena vitilis]
MFRCRIRRTGTCTCAAHVARAVARRALRGGWAMGWARGRAANADGLRLRRHPRSESVCATSQMCGTRNDGYAGGGKRHAQWNAWRDATGRRACGVRDVYARRDARSYRRTLEGDSCRSARRIECGACEGDMCEGDVRQTRSRGENTEREEAKILLPFDASAGNDYGAADGQGEGAIRNAIVCGDRRLRVPCAAGCSLDEAEAGHRWGSGTPKMRVGVAADSNAGGAGHPCARRLATYEEATSGLCVRAGERRHRGGKGQASRRKGYRVDERSSCHWEFSKDCQIAG